MPEDKNMAEEKFLAKLKSLLCMLESESCSWSQIKKVSEELVPELKLVSQVMRSDCKVA